MLQNRVKMPGIEDKNDSEEEDMEQDTPDSDKSDDDDSELGSESEGDESSAELDEVEAELKRDEYVFDMSDLERQFMELKEQLYLERLAQVEDKLNEVKSGRALEYLNPLAQLQENMRIRMQVAGILRQLKTQNIQNKYEAEKQAADQNYESEKGLLYDQVKGDLRDKIRHLEEDRHNIDITSDLWNESHSGKRKKRAGVSTSDRRRKPVTITGPYIVYLLKDADVIDDWTQIKKALKQSEKKKKDLMKEEKHPYSARFDDGKLFYEGDWYNKGHSIIIDNREDSPVRASITAINTGEVWVKRVDGNKSKLYIAQLQKGKYTIKHIVY